MARYDPHRTAWRTGVAIAGMAAAVGTAGASVFITSTFFTFFPDIQPPGTTTIWGLAAGLWLATWMLSGLALQTGDCLKG